MRKRRSLDRFGQIFDEEGSARTTLDFLYTEGGTAGAMSGDVACVCVCVRASVCTHACECVCLGSREDSRCGSCSLSGVRGRAGGSGEQSRTRWGKVCVLGGNFPAWPATAACSGEEGSSAQGGRRRGR